jgi:hypothetical protein
VVVPLVPDLEAMPDVGGGGAGRHAEEGVGEVGAVVVELAREVIGLGLDSCHAGRVLVHLVDERAAPCCRRIE